MNQTQPRRIYVDAKIINRDSKDKPKRTFIAHVSDDGKEKNYKEIKEVDAHETDAAELYAIHFAIEELKNKPGKFVFLCDHESVVFILQQDKPNFGNKTRQIMKDVWESIHESSKQFEIEPHSNKADKFLNDVWREIKMKE